MTRKGRRLMLIGIALAIIGLAVGLAAYALKDNIVFFYGPTEVLQKNPAAGTRLRIGGLVKAGSLVKAEGQKATFASKPTASLFDPSPAVNSDLGDTVSPSALTVLSLIVSSNLGNCVPNNYCPWSVSTFTQVFDNLARFCLRQAKIALSPWSIMARQK